MTNYTDYVSPRFDENGFMTLNDEYTEIIRLHDMLDNAGIPHVFRRMYDGWQVVYPDTGAWKISAVQHFFSYGSRKNLIEIMGGITPEDNTDNSVLGLLTAENVFGRISTMHHNDSTDTNVGRNAEHCVCCGDVIPEGRQVCPKCEEGGCCENRID